LNKTIFCKKFTKTRTIPVYVKYVLFVNESRLFLHNSMFAEIFVAYTVIFFKKAY